MSVQYDPWPLIRFDVIKTAWALYKRHAMVWSLAMLIALVVYAGVGSLAHSLFGGHAHFHHGGVRMSHPGSGPLDFFVSTVVWGYFLGGMVRMASNQIRGRTPRIEDLFTVSNHWFDLVLVSLLVGAANTVGYTLLVLPGLVVSGLLMLAIPLVVEGELPATGAIIHSWNALKSQWLTAAAFHLALVFAAASGLLLFGVGVLFTGPIYCLAIALVHHRFYPVSPIHATHKDPEPVPEV